MTTRDVAVCLVVCAVSIIVILALYWEIQRLQLRCQRYKRMEDFLRQENTNLSNALVSLSNRYKSAAEQAGEPAQAAAYDTLAQHFAPKQKDAEHVES